ncbi:MAG: hypothetical protein KGO50_08420 [Myxococcales bacterium]|nr:hypothetical protein [Myxococcales bacterium]
MRIPQMHRIEDVRMGERIRSRRLVLTDAELGDLVDGGTGLDLMQLPADVDEVQLLAPELRAVDILLPASVKQLNVSGCAPGLHVRLVERGGLYRLVVPPEGPGAVVRVWSDTQVGQLYISGLVQELDACLPTEESDTRLEIRECLRIGEAPWDDARITHATAFYADETPELVVYAGGTWAGTTNVLKKKALARRLAAYGVTYPSYVELRKAMPSVSFVGCSFTKLVGESVQRLHIVDNPQLRLIELYGRHLRIQGLCAEDLVARGHWHRISMRNCPVRFLYVGSPVQLGLHGCSELKSLHGQLGSTDLNVVGGPVPNMSGDARLLLSPRTPEEARQLLESGHAPTAAAVLDWACSTRNRSTLWIALRTMCIAAELGMHGDELWQRRDSLRALHHGGHPQAWWWDFPADLALRGWSDDVRLWLRCVSQGVEAPLQAMDAMCESVTPSSLAALCLVMLDAGLSVDEQQLVRELFVQQCHAAIRHRGFGVSHRKARGDIEAGGREALMLVVSLLLRHPERQQAAELADLLAEVVKVTLWRMSAATVLGAMHRHGCRRAAECLTELTRMRPVEGEPAQGAALIQTVVLMLAQKPQQPCFSYAGSDDPGLTTGQLADETVSNTEVGALF